ncbi:MAG: sortase A [Halieaceae bacterium]|jgi:sortase A
MPVNASKTLFQLGEWSSYAVGVLLAGFFVVQLAQGEVDRRSDISHFEQMAALETAPSVPVSSNEVPASKVPVISDTTKRPDMSLWAPQRIADYEASLRIGLPPILGVLEVPSVGLKVPVYPTDSELTMDRGAGVIVGMSYPHEDGNIGIAGHRDGYFRALKDVQVGDHIALQTLHGPKRFTINSVQVVEISDTHLLQDTDDQTVTLVTCYPFYFVGNAPQRFIVTASLDSTNIIQQ